MAGPAGFPTIRKFLAGQATLNDWVVCTLTVNEISNYGRHGVKPVIFVLNNSGFAVEPNGELEAAMQKAEAADEASYIEIVAGKHDYPAGLKLLHTRMPEMYGI